MRFRVRTIICLLCLLFPLVVEEVSAQSAGSQSGLSVTVLLDLSYSMGLPLSLNKDDPRGPTRLDEAKYLITDLLNATKGNIEWSLATFGGAATEAAGQSVEVRQGFTTDVGRVKAEIGGLKAWGITPLTAAIEFGLDYSNRNARLPRRALLVVTDGVDTSPSLFEMPSPTPLSENSTPIVFASVNLTQQPRLSSRLAAWVREAGGLEVDAATPVAVEAALSRVLTEGRSAAAPGSGMQSDAGRSAGGAVAPNSSGPEAESPAARRASGLGWIAILLIVLALFPLAILVVRRRGHRRRRAAALRFQKEIKVLKFAIERGGITEEREFIELPIFLSGASQAGKAKGSVKVTIEEDATTLTSRNLVLVNGVGARHHTLRFGDRVHVSGGVWTYRGEERRRTGPPEPSRPHPLPYLLACAVFCLGALAFVFAGPTTQWGHRAQGTGSLVGRDSQAATIAAAGASAPGATRGRSGALPASTERAVSLVGGDEGAHAFLATQMVPPGQKPSFFKADVMFIHTHPDDESIDFGGLMALESRSGQRVVTVLFTDGTAGLDQYPNRPTGGIYPAHDLRGSALARVRVGEAEAAMSILGSRAYVRLGLLNNPYDSIREILPLREVLRRWGGEAEVVSRLVSLMAGYRPEIVVSPDKHHPGVFKHFEHEAVGYITDEALRYLREHGMDFVRAHLVAVDPMLRSQYPSAFGVNVMAIDPSSGLSYRAIQVAALKKHETQRDASVIAVEVVSNFADEYYAAPFWNLPIAPSVYFSGTRARNEPMSEPSTVQGLH